MNQINSINLWTYNGNKFFKITFSNSRKRYFQCIDEDYICFEEFSFKNNQKIFLGKLKEISLYNMLKEEYEERLDFEAEMQSNYFEMF